MAQLLAKLTLMVGGVLTMLAFVVFQFFPNLFSSDVVVC